jgi:hypothetical protein
MGDEAKRPMTQAERQRAWRERKKLEQQQPATPRRGPGRPRKSPAPGDDTGAPAMSQGSPGPALPDLGDDSNADDDVTVTRLNAYMRRCFFTAFEQVGATRYLENVAHKSPGVFLRFGQQFVTREETTNPALRIIVQKLTLEAAQPVAGVYCSPIAQHIAPPRYIPGPPGGEVIDAEEVPDA